MPSIIPRKVDSVEQNWLKQLANAISDSTSLLNQLEITPTSELHSLEARKSFAQRVPISFVDRMEKGNPQDPLLLQVLPQPAELLSHEGYSCDPLGEQDNPVEGLLHKYKNRALMIVKGACAINCRYCFRRHFPYNENKGNKATWQKAIDYLHTQSDLNEILLSGGDPLMAKDHELEWLIEAIAAIPHIKRLRIHSRLPVVIPARITDKLCQLLQQTRLQVVLVTHINHANEINTELRNSMNKLRQHGVTLLNQGVFLKGVNDSVQAQVNLGEALFSAQILPYYMHVLDKVQGAAHFFISDEEVKEIMSQVIEQTSGYLVPKITREIAGRKSKTVLDLHLE